jgi:predicted MPP superfamily phosphohydrolase
MVSYTLTVISLLLVVSETARIVVISDLHFGEGRNQAKLAKEAIHAVTQLSPPPEAVFITGDITSSALPEQFAQAKEALSPLSGLKYFPCFGNHDVWQYRRSPEYWQEPFPTGDRLFRETFEENFKENATAYDFQTRWSAKYAVNATLINFEVRLNTSAGVLLLLGLDFSTRGPATNPKDDFRGGGPGAFAHPPTLEFLRSRFDVAIEEGLRVSQVIIFMHHNPSGGPFFLPDYFSFSESDRGALLQVIDSYPSLPIHFAIVGHLHFSDNRQAITGLQQIVVTAAKEEGSNALLVVDVDDTTGQVEIGTVYQMKTGQLLRCLISIIAGIVISICSIIIARLVHSKLLICNANATFVITSVLIILSFLSVVVMMLMLRKYLAPLSQHLTVDFSVDVLAIVGTIAGCFLVPSQQTYIHLKLVCGMSLLVASMLVLDITRNFFLTNYVVPSSPYIIFMFIPICIAFMVANYFSSRSHRGNGVSHPLNPSLRASVSTTTIASLAVGSCLFLPSGIVSSLLWFLFMPISTVGSYVIYAGIVVVYILTAILFVANLYLAASYVPISVLLCSSAGFQSIFATLFQFACRQTTYDIPISIVTVIAFGCFGLVSGSVVTSLASTLLMTEIYESDSTEEVLALKTDQHV